MKRIEKQFYTEKNFKLLEDVIIDAIDPKKDADGFHALNVGRNSIGGDLLKKSFVPCTPLGCFLMLKRSVPNLVGMHAASLCEN